MDVTWKEILLSGAFWFHGLLSAAVGGAATTISVMVVDADTFNIETGFKKILTVAAVSAIINVAAYLKLSPMPRIQKNLAAARLAPPK